MIPGRSLIVLLALLGICSIVGAFIPAATGIWSVCAAVAAIIVTVDAIFCIRTPSPHVERTVAGSMSLQTWTDVQVVVRNDAANRRLKLSVFDRHPPSVTAKGLPYTFEVDANHFVEFSYRVRPTQRGQVEFSTCDVRVASPLGFWWRIRRAGTPSTVRVYPNYSTISKLLAYEVDNRLRLSGVRLSRRRGEGIEFDQLRDYRDGDSLRSIDWKASARMGRFIAREYQDERDQQIVFVLDAGRRMLSKDAGLSHFDHTLNALLLLSYTALRQGDAVGVMTVGKNRTWLPPQKGADSINVLLNHVYDTQAHAAEVDYIAAATDLSARQRRRSLVVILTNVREEDSEDLIVATDLLRRKHLVMLASLRERVLDDTLTEEIHGFDDAVRAAATDQYLNSRREAQKLLQARGIFVEDCLSDELPSAITNRYLAIKRAGAL